ncbi:MULTISPECIES: DUF1513 domain-containing protein [unclassified Psychrobacter]|uniref:DUF1513 domain-containing protein n=1 Tax=unclassified Psychrobacter TaxID=196806 RepID=UPI000EC4048E|nr:MULTISPECIES: DUF1513 domain-containing protein [unclassified Psychrobacter]HCI75515.1 DUF1513 domain-containing protein [Psychrobacter sp.]
MHSIDAKTAKKSQQQLEDKQSNNELLATSALTMLSTVMGTVALVSIHHRYRKQRHPDASLQDYVVGIRSQLQSLTSTPKPQLARFSHAYHQAAAAWQHAYHLPIDDRQNTNHHRVADFSALHTTTVLTRPICWVSGVASMPKNSVLANDDRRDDNDFGVVGIDADRQIVWQTTMPERVHDIVVQPVADIQNTFIGSRNRDVVVMGRRPSEKFWVLDTTTGQVKFAIKASTYRHFYGHACYSLDGKLLYVTENDTISLDGKIGIYDVYDNYKKIAEYDSHGIGPHELIMHPDGETLVIANGGIKTEQASREELNLDSMRPSLVYLNRHTGVLLEQLAPEHNQMSVRHLAMHDDGTVMIGIQFQGEKHINVPLVLMHKRGDTDFKALIMPNNQWQRFHQYIASVAVDSARNLLCVTTPIGGCAAIYDLNTRTLINDVSLPDCAGASVLCHQSANKTDNHDVQSGFIVSDGQGQLTRLTVNDLSIPNSDIVTTNQAIVKDSQCHMMSFDNHLQAL